MERNVVLKLWEAQEQMRTDTEYRELISEWEGRNAAFMDVLNSLDAQTQGAILDYLEYLLELHYKTAEYLLK